MNTLVIRGIDHSVETSVEMAIDHSVDSLVIRGIDHSPETSVKMAIDHAWIPL